MDSLTWKLHLLKIYSECNYWLIRGGQLRIGCRNQPKDLSGTQTLFEQMATTSKKGIEKVVPNVFDPHREVLLEVMNTRKRVSKKLEQFPDIFLHDMLI